MAHSPVLKFWMYGQTRVMVLVIEFGKLFLNGIYGKCPPGFKVWRALVCTEYDVTCLLCTRSLL
jgi:hypothetical protein